LVRPSCTAIFFFKAYQRGGHVAFPM
jgi:hypothetical protein